MTAAPAAARAAQTATRLAPTEADTSAVTQPAALPGDPGRRGRTVLADRVVAKVAAQACAEVDHVHPTSPALAGRVLHQQPAIAADADVDGHLVQLRVQVAVDYPVSLAGVTAALREHVTSRMTQLCELTVTDMDIRVAELRYDSAPGRRVL